MRSPVFFRSKVERLERAGDLRAIIAVLSGHTDKLYERAHAAKALVDSADRLGPIREQAVAVLTLAAEEPTDVRTWALFALAELREPSRADGSLPVGPRGRQGRARDAELVRLI
jgi:hypothetical protein